MAIKLIHLQLIYGVAGAREKFEDLVIHLIHSEHPDIKRVRIYRGDDGVDAHQGSLVSTEGIDVFQVKFFPDGIGDSQKSQIRESFAAVRDSGNFKASSWTLCLPIDLSIDEKKWFDTWKAKQKGVGIDIRPPWDAFKLEGLLYQERNRHIKEEFFKDEYLNQIRDMQETLTELVHDFKERVPKPISLVLHPSLEDVRARRTYNYDTDMIVVEMELCFSVENVSSQSVSNWNVRCEIDLPDDVCLTRETFPKLGSGSSYIRLNSPILPTLAMTTEVIYGLKIDRKKVFDTQIRQLLEPAQVRYQAISDNHVGDKITTPLKHKINWTKLLRTMKESLKKENIELD